MYVTHERQYVIIVHGYTPTSDKNLENTSGDSNSGRGERGYHAHDFSELELFGKFGHLVGKIKKIVYSSIFLEFLHSKIPYGIHFFFLSFLLKPMFIKFRLLPNVSLIFLVYKQLII